MLIGQGVCLYRLIGPCTLSVTGTEPVSPALLAPCHTAALRQATAKYHGLITQEITANISATRDQRRRRRRGVDGAQECRVMQQSGGRRCV